MKSLSFTTALFLSTALSVAAFGAFQDDEINSLQGKLLSATDARDADNAAFDEAIKAKKYEALRFLGQIGGDACQRLMPFLRSESVEARVWASKGAMLCHDKALTPYILAQMETASDKTPWVEALGYTGADEAKTSITAVLNNAQQADEQRAALFALVQSVAYDRTNAADIPALDIGALLHIAVKDNASGGSDTAYAASYLLARLQNVQDTLSFEVFSPILSDLLSNSHKRTGVALETVRTLTRVAGAYGNQSVQLLLAAVEEEQVIIRHEAIRSMGQLSDSTTKAILLKLADSDAEPAVIRHLAVDALGRRSETNPDLIGVLEQYVSDDNRWVATTALRWLGQRDAVAANEVAAEWLSGADYYLAFQALIALSGSDEGKAVLQAYADANPDTVRGFEAAVALDPSLEAITKPRKTPSQSVLSAYEGRELILETSRGTVCIAMTGDAPYAATNFMQLADVGKLDGMLWHRVIPNFVSQAGQVEDKDLNNWGSIREEWGGEHRIGTVGVATAGRDTGTVQFFINTGYNMHLDNRYTVFGEVYGSMNVVYALEEGDVISKAYTAKAGEAGCK